MVGFGALVHQWWRRRCWCNGSLPSPAHVPRQNSSGWHWSEHRGGYFVGPRQCLIPKWWDLVQYWQKGGAGAAASRPSPSPHVPEPQLPLALASVGLQGSQLVSSLPHNQPKSCWFSCHMGKWTEPAENRLCCKRSSNYQVIWRKFSRFFVCQNEWVTHPRWNLPQPRIVFEEVPIICSFSRKMPKHNPFEEVSIILLLFQKDAKAEPFWQDRGQFSTGESDKEKQRARAWKNSSGEARCLRLPDTATGTGSSWWWGGRALWI